MPSLNDRNDVFFQRFAWFLLLFVIASFGAKAVFDTEDLPPLTWLHHFHAVAITIFMPSPCCRGLCCSRCSRRSLDEESPACIACSGGVVRWWSSRSSALPCRSRC